MNWGVQPPPNINLRSETETFMGHILLLIRILGFEPQHPFNDSE
jgi:hypothetical protein